MGRRSVRETPRSEFSGGLSGFTTADQETGVWPEGFGDFWPQKSQGMRRKKENCVAA